MKEESSSKVKLLTASMNGDSSHAVAMSEDGDQGDQREDDPLVDAILGELDGRVDREQIERLLLEAHALYQDAPVKIYLSIIIRRYVMEKLR